MWYVVCMCVSPLYGILCRDFPVVLSHEALGLLYIAGGAAGVILVWLGGVVHLPNDLSEQFVHHGFALGRRLHEGAAPCFSQSLALAGRHLPLALQVHLVPNQDHGHLLISDQDKHRDTHTHTSDVTLQCLTQIHSFTAAFTAALPSENKHV